MERLPDNKIQEKLARVFKAVISAGLVAPVFVSVSACEKAKPVVEESESSVLETTPKTTTPVETTAQETQETAPATTEVVETGPIEYEGVMINPIEGLRFDKGTFFALEGNPYGLEAETKAGVFIKDAFEFNGVMENSIGLRPEVIEYLQGKGVKEKKELRFAIPLISLEEKSGLKIDIVEDIAKNDPSSEYAKVNFLEKCTYLGISGIQNEITLCSPVKSLEKFEVGGAEWGRINFSPLFPDRDINNTFNFIIYPDKELVENTVWKKIYPIHSSNLLINCSSVELLIKESSGVNSSKGWENNYWLRTTSGGVGFNLAKIVGPVDQEVLEMIEGGLGDFLPDYQILMQYVVQEYDFDKEKQQYFLKAHVYTGEEILMEESGLKISFLPADE